MYHYRRVTKNILPYRFTVKIGYTIMMYTVRAHFYVHVWKPYKSIRLVILTMYAV